PPSLHVRQEPVAKHEAPVRPLERTSKPESAHHPTRATRATRVPPAVDRASEERAKVDARPPAAPASDTGTAATQVDPQAPPLGAGEGSAAGGTGGMAGGTVGGLGSTVTPLASASVAPKILRSYLPVYPERARLRGIEGEVLIEAVIASDGSVEPEIRIVRSI